VRVNGGVDPVPCPSATQRAAGNGTIPAGDGGAAQGAGGPDERDLRRCRASPLLVWAARCRPLRPTVVDLASRLEGGPFYSLSLRRIFASIYGVTVGAYSYGQCFVRGGLPRGTRVGRYCSIAQCVRIFLRDHPVDHLSTHPFFFNSRLGLLPRDAIALSACSIGHDVWIGERAILTARCRTVGNGAVIGAGAVVTHDVPEFAVVAGCPARILRFRFSEATRDVVRRSEWWLLPVSECARAMEYMTRGLEDVVASHPLLHPALRARQSGG
jgi:acetyltransferase-like isoleucine patch superfamily enzyme